MTSHRAQLVALLAKINQKIAEAYEIGNDESTDMYKLFEVCDCLDSLRKSQRRAERLLQSPEGR